MDAGRTGPGRISDRRRHHRSTLRWCTRAPTRSGSPGHADFDTDDGARIRSSAAMTRLAVLLGVRPRQRWGDSTCAGAGQIGTVLRRVGPTPRAAAGRRGCNQSPASSVSSPKDHRCGAAAVVEPAAYRAVAATVNTAQPPGEGAFFLAVGACALNRVQTSTSPLSPAEAVPRMRAIRLLGLRVRLAVKCARGGRLTGMARSSANFRGGDAVEQPTERPGSPRFVRR